MEPVQLRKLASRLEAAGHRDLAIRARNRAASRELGVERLRESGARHASSLVMRDAFPLRRERPRREPS